MLLKFVSKTSANSRAAFQLTPTFHGFALLVFATGYNLPNLWQDNCYIIKSQYMYVYYKAQ